jgi:hypothetical protein
MFTRDARTPSELVVGITVDTGGLPTTVKVEYGSPKRTTRELALPGVPSPGGWAPTKRIVRIPMAGLIPGRHYLARVVAANAAGQAAFVDDVIAGKRRSGVALPVVSSGAAPSSAVIQTVIDTGGLPTTYYVEYGTRPSYGKTTAPRKLPAQPGKNWNRTSKEIEVTLTGLEPATTYYYRVVAKNASRVDFAGRSFVTGGLKPNVSYVFAGSGAGAPSLVFGAGIDTGGLQTTYHVEYGPNLSYGAQTQDVTIPAVPRPASFRSTFDDIRAPEIVPQAGTTYHYRVVAVNAAGTSYSQDHTVVAR